MHKARKLFLIADGELIFDTYSSSHAPENILKEYPRNFISIETATTPTAGTFDAFVELVPDGGFHGATVIGGTGTTINGTSIGAEVADGGAEGWSFNGNPNRIKVVATGVTGVTEVYVTISQNME